MCGTGHCIDIRLVCNDFSDCRDGSDEYFCSYCPENEFQCDDRSCVSRQQLCDGRPDCRDGSDESERAGCCIAPYFYRCNDGFCIESQRKCDGFLDCEDGADEVNCCKLEAVWVKEEERREEKEGRGQREVIMRGGI